MIKVPSFGSKLGKNIVEVPEMINSCSTRRVFGPLTISLLFSTDVAMSYVVPSTSELFKDIMLKYRSQ